MNNIFRRVLIILVISAWTLSCSEKRPEGILTHEEMVQVMEEMYVAEEKVNQLALSRDSAKQVARLITKKVFADAGVSDSIFLKSLDYYMERPQEMEHIYSVLVDTLQLREQRAPFSHTDP